MDAYLFLQEVRRKNPVVHHLTNWVTIYDCAQAVKSLGASPVMAHAPEEAADMAGIASALVLNIGTLTTEFVESMKIAARAANKRNIPVTLDACGAGATSFRDEKSFQLLDTVRIDIIKGNASEIARLAGKDVRTRGVDTGDVGDDPRGIAARLAEQRKCVVALTGPEDIVAAADGSIHVVRNGHEMMSGVVGTGCMAASVIGTFTGARPDVPAEATAAGLACFGMAGELAAFSCAGPASFKTRLLDHLHTITKEEVASMQRIA